MSLAGSTQPGRAANFAASQPARASVEAAEFAATLRAQNKHKDG